METVGPNRWQLVGVVTDGQEIRIGGINAWDHEWISLNQEAITVHHPEYPTQHHQLQAYEIATNEGTLVFAAGEVSNGVWAFFRPSDTG